MQPTASQLAANWIAALERSGMSRREICDLTGLSKPTVWRYATGEVHSPSFLTMQRLAAVYAAAGRPPIGCERSSGG
jgi:transcriptional regulator with XRE-family HTH domain